MMRSFLYRLYRIWSDEHLSLFAGGIAFAVIFSLPSIIVLLAAITGAFIGPDAAANMLESRLTMLFGQHADTLQPLVRTIRIPALGVFGKTVSISVLVLSALSAVVTVRTALAHILNMDRAQQTFLAWIRGYVASLFLIVFSAVVIAGNVLLSTVITLLDRALVRATNIPENLLVLGNLGVSLVLIFLLFTLLYIFLPPKRVALIPALGGALFATLFFILGKEALAFLITWSNPGSAYGAAGSVLALLFWIFVSAEIFLLGAGCIRLMLGVKRNA